VNFVKIYQTAKVIVFSKLHNHLKNLSRIGQKIWKRERETFTDAKKVLEKVKFQDAFNSSPCFLVDCMWE